MFKITEGKGFHIKFKNNLNVSVQFGYGNYCNNHDISDNAHVTCNNAEVAMWYEGGDFISFDNGDEVSGYLDAEDVLKVLVWAESQPAKEN